MWTSCIERINYRAIAVPIYIAVMLGLFISPLGCSPIFGIILAIPLGIIGAFAGFSFDVKTAAEGLFLIVTGVVWSWMLVRTVAALCWQYKQGKLDIDQIVLGAGMAFAVIGAGFLWVYG